MVVFGSRNNDPVRLTNLLVEGLNDWGVCLIIGLIKHRDLVNIQDFNVGLFGKMFGHELQ